MMFVFICIRRCGWVVALLVAGVTISTGCNRGPKMAQISGVVHYKDGSVPKGGVCIIRFSPTQETTAEVRQGASGAIGPDGRFTLRSKTADDGVYYGDYAVTFAVWPGPMDPRSLILPKYTAPMMTPYKVTVDGDRDDLKFEIEPMPGGPAAAGS
jgi:hypothetical protein